MNQKPLVSNAGNEEEVKRAEQISKRKADQEKQDLKALLKLDEGRRFLWRLLEQCKVFESIWEPSAKIHYNAGQQDLGHFVLAEIVAADETALLRMMQENKQGD